jgi:hypothetical protein
MLADCGLYVNLCIIFAEVIEDTTRLVAALQENVPLQREFISLLRKPNKNLLKLSRELHALRERLAGQCEEGQSETSFPDLLVHLSTSSPHTLDQVKALTIATEAFRELSTSAVERILKLTTEEKNNIFILFRKIPPLSSAHGFINPAMPDTDPVYNQLLVKIGFTDWRGHLMYEKQTGDCGLDKVTLTIIAIHSVTNTSSSPRT